MRLATISHEGRPTVATADPAEGPSSSLGEVAPGRAPPIAGEANVAGLRVNRQARRSIGALPAVHTPALVEPASGGAALPRDNAVEMEFARPGTSRNTVRRMARGQQQAPAREAATAS